MSTFNASLARNVSLVADELLQAQLAGFLYDPSHAVDMTPQHLRIVPCSQGPNSHAEQSCKRTYFIPAGFESGTSVPRGDQALEEDAILAKDQQGYILNFQEESDQSGFDEEHECETYGFSFAGFRMCLHNVEANTIRARKWRLAREEVPRLILVTQGMVNCPSEISALAQCRSNTSWHSDPGWITTVTSTFRKATVAYSRSNGTILSTQFSDAPETPAPVDAIAMLHGYLDAYGDFDNLKSLLSMLQTPDGTNLFPLYVYPAFIWANLKGVSLLGPHNPAIATRAADTLQCILAIMLYYCQPSLFARALSKPAGSAPLGANEGALQRLKAEVLAAAPADTEISLARLRYQIEVGQATYVAYVVLCGSTLVLCIVLLLLGSYAPLAGRIPNTSAFPALNDNAYCRLVSAGGGDGIRSECFRTLKSSQHVRAAADMKIVLADVQAQYEAIPLHEQNEDRSGVPCSREPQPADRGWEHQSTATTRIPSKAASFLGADSVKGMI